VAALTNFPVIWLFSNLLVDGECIFITGFFDSAMVAHLAFAIMTLVHKVPQALDMVYTLMGIHLRIKSIPQTPWTETIFSIIKTSVHRPR